MIIYNRIIPFKGFWAINLFGLIFARSEYQDREHTVSGERMINHERIHTAQMKEMLFVFFYLWYLAEWIIRLVKGQPYEAISFEREAYERETNLAWIKERKKYYWIKFI